MATYSQISRRAAGSLSAAPVPAAVRTRMWQQRQKRPQPQATAKASKPLPAFMQGIAGSLRAQRAPTKPGGNVASLLASRGAPQHTATMLRSATTQPRFGPVVGPRVGQIAAVLQANSGFGSLGDPGVGGWFDSIRSVVTAIIPKHTIVGKLLGGDVGGAIKGASGLIRRPSTPPPPPPPPPDVPTGVIDQVYQSFKPQNESQKWMLGGAAVLGVGLIALLVLRRR